MKNSSRKTKRPLIKHKGLIIIPPALCALMCLTVFLVTAPFISDFISIGRMFISDKQIDYSGSYENIFIPSENNGSTVNAEDVKFPGINKQFGELKIKRVGVDAKLFFGDGKTALRNGVGVYAGSFIPGYGRTILIAGHNNTYFNGLKNVKIGDIVKISTSYGNYEYKINKTKLFDGNYKKAYDLNAEKENLILYTCYPFDRIGLTSQRYFVYAEKISGPDIVGLYE